MGRPHLVQFGGKPCTLAFVRGDPGLEPAVRFPLVDDDFQTRGAVGLAVFKVAAQVGEFGGP